MMLKEPPRSWDKTRAQGTYVAVKIGLGAEISQKGGFLREGKTDGKRGRSQRVVLCEDEVKRTGKNVRRGGLCEAIK